MSTTASGITTQAVLAFRLLWFLLPLTLGQLASDALADAAPAVPRVATIGLWVLWAVALIAAMVPTPFSLTVVRMIAPGAVVVAIYGLVVEGASALGAVALAHSASAAVVAFTSFFGDRFVDGGSYGDERRMLLRPPAAIAYAVGPLLWLTAAASVVTGPLLLATQRWLLGAVACVVGLGVIAVAGRALHQLARRWIVFVPTGMVLHDLMVLTEPVLFRRTAIERLGAAIAGTPARDLSNNASGLLLECELTDPAPLGLRTRPGSDQASLTDVRRWLFCPSRPGALLDEAEARNIPTD